MDNSKFWLCFWALVGTLIVLMATIISAYVLVEKHIMMQNGYEEVYDPAANRILLKKKG